jgi:hypothetical protein
LRKKYKNDKTRDTMKREKNDIERYEDRNALKRHIYHNPKRRENP